MLNTEHPSFWLACLLAIASGGVYLLRFARPAASREYDVIFAVAGLIYAIILGWEGWRLIPLLFLAQVLVLAIAIFFTVETFRLRVLLVDKAKRSGGSVSSGPGRRGGGGGFNRTYEPRQYDPAGRPVPGRSSNRMRNAEPDDDDMPRSRTLRAANKRRPQLASASTSARRGARPPASDRDDLGNRGRRPRYENSRGYDEGGYDEGGYDDRDNRAEFNGREPRRDYPRRSDRPTRRPPAPTTRRRPVSRPTREGYGSGRDEYGAPPQAAAPRRRPPSIPERDGDVDTEPVVRRTISVDAGPVESEVPDTYDADFDRFDEGYSEEY
ncbi:MAG: Ycf66 family protein [Cyanobacteria bacterium J06639_1]